MSRLGSLSQDLAGSAYDLTHGFAYNPASQITSLTRSNDTYAFTGHANVDRGYTSNGLNQYSASGSTSLGYDGRGNLTSSGGSSYGYTIENMLKTGPGGVTLAYDPGGRLIQTVGSVETRFAYDGSDLIAEYNSANTLLRRYVHGPGNDEPLVWYEGAGTSDRRWLHADERGSVVAVSDGSGAAIAGGIHAYDEYGIPGGNYASRFQYTGQAWIPEIGMYHYKARAYSPTLGRFMQTDPIGYGDGLNLYAYVGNDPVNRVDPSGLAGCRGRPTSTFIGDVEVITVTGCGEKGGGVGSTTGPTRIVGGGAVNGGGGGGVGVGPSADGDVEEVVVTGTRILKVNDWPQTRIDPRNYPRVEACIKFAHECLAQPTTVTPNARGQCLGAELMCYAEAYLRGKTANDRRSFDYCHNYSCFYISPNGKVTFYDKRFNR